LACVSESHFAKPVLYEVFFWEGKKKKKNLF
jgi:hypothetical protein